MANEMNLDKLPEILQQKANTLNDNLTLALKQCGEKIRSDIRYDMAHTERSDKGYHTHNKTKLHYPSTPGNPPAPDTGNLRESINYEVITDQGEVYGIVGTTQQNPPYGKWLEFGTTKGLKPRPWLRPAMLKNADFIKTVIGQAIKKTLMGGNVK